jgi:hypothetical protein
VLGSTVVLSGPSSSCWVANKAEVGSHSTAHRGWEVEACRGTTGGMQGVWYMLPMAAWLVQGCIETSWSTGLRQALTLGCQGQQSTYRDVNCTLMLPGSTCGAGEIDHSCCHPTSPHSTRYPCLQHASLHLDVRLSTSTCPCPPPCLHPPHRATPGVPFIVLAAAGPRLAGAAAYQKVLTPGAPPRGLAAVQCRVTPAVRG